VQACPHCGWLLQLDYKFCPGCGITISILTNSAADSLSQTTEGSRPINYTPRHLVDQILTERATVEGELKQATILFADIVDSTRLTYGKDPEAADKIIGPAIEEMRKAVFRYDGYVRPRGDGIQALFGVPLSHEDHAVRGCLAALDIIKGIEDSNVHTGDTLGARIQVRVGLNSGEVIVKRIRDDLLIELDAIGATVALASRMENLASPGTVQITASTFALAERFVRADLRGKIAVRGVNQPVDVFQLKAVRHSPTRFHHVSDGGIATFVGRELELETLAYAWQQVRTGEGQVVALVGEPGVGKSRILSEFIRSRLTEGSLVLEARSASYGQATPYQPVTNLLRDYFDVHALSDEKEIKKRIDDRLASLDPALIPQRVAMFYLLNLSIDDAAWSQCDAFERRQKVHEAIIEIILRQAESQPMCVIFEDLHWIDGETQTLLNKIVDDIPARSILLLVSYRPEHQMNWGRKTYFRQLPIGPLPDATAYSLLDDLIGTHAELSSLKRRLIEQTAGNPLFLEECIQMLKEQSRLLGQRGKAELAQPINDIDFLPASVQSTLKARIDRLGSDEKHVLDFASIIGKEFSYADLNAAIDISTGSLQACLQKLQALEFIRQIRRFPDAEYTFKHALACQVAYRSLLTERRRRMHSAVMRGIEKRYKSRTADHIEELARHAWHGGIWDKAVSYSFAAGKKSFDRSAHKETVQHLEQALKALPHVPENEETRLLGIEVRFLLRYALLNLGEIPRVGELLDQMGPLITSVDVAQRTGQFEAFRSNYYCLTGDQSRAVEHGLRALQIAVSTNDRVLRLEMAYRLAQPYYHLARYREAIELLEDAVRLIGPDDALSRLGMSAMPMVVCRTWLTVCCAELGEFVSATRHASMAVELVGETQHPLSIAFAYWGLGQLCLQRRDYSGAEVAFKTGLQACERWSLRFWFSRLASGLGMAKALGGDGDAALSLLEAALREAQSMHLRVDASPLSERLATVHLLSGRYAMAESEACHALQLAVQSRAEGHQAWALRLLGEVFSANERPDWERVMSSFNNALELAGSLGMRPLSALCHEGIARMHEKLGSHDRAQAAFGDANRIWAATQA
jgi:class 3 adenylate cyclase/tetratricopeptide (TPR) repeat protein